MVGRWVRFVLSHGRVRVARGLSRLVLPLFILLVACSASIPLLQRLRARPRSSPAPAPWALLGEPDGTDPPPLPPLPPRATIMDPSALRFRQRHPELYRATAPPPSPLRLVADFEPMEAVYLPWTPGVADDFHRRVIQAVLRYTRAVPALLFHGPVEREELEDLMLNWNLPPARVRFIDASTLGPYHVPAPDHPDARAVQSMWVRDWGPIYVENSNGFAVVDTQYWSDRANDDSLPTKLARLEGRAVYRTRLALEGGNLLTDGVGTCFTADPPELATSETADDLTDQALARFFGCQQVVWLSAMNGEPTGHADMFLMVGENDTVLLGYYRPDQDPANYFLLNENADLLRTTRAASGRRMRVLRVPMPDNGDNIYRTYLNALVINRLVLYPRYEGYEYLEGRVRQAFHQAFPGRTVVPVDVEELLFSGGAIHCATRGRPRAAARRR